MKNGFSLYAHTRIQDPRSQIQDPASGARLTMCPDSTKGPPLLPDSIVLLRLFAVGLSPAFYGFAPPCRHFYGAAEECADLVPSRNPIDHRDLSPPIVRSSIAPRGQMQCACEPAPSVYHEKNLDLLDGCCWPRPCFIVLYYMDEAQRDLALEAGIVTDQSKRRERLAVVFTPFDSKIPYGLDRNTHTTMPCSVRWSPRTAPPHDSAPKILSHAATTQVRSHCAAGARLTTSDMWRISWNRRIFHSRDRRSIRISLLVSRWSHCQGRGTSPTPSKEVAPRQFFRCSS